MDARFQAERKLAQTLIESRPDAAAAALEELPSEEAREVLRQAGAGPSALVLDRMAPASAAAILAEMPADEASDRITKLPLHSVATILRRMPAPARERGLAGLPTDVRPGIQVLLDYPEGTAGALADPQVLVVPADLDVRHARARALERPSEAHYNLYVIERSGRLVGVMNLRELFASRESDPLTAVMREPIYRIHARAQRMEVIGHPGWKRVHSLPVVEDGERLLGAIRFRTLRELETELLRGRHADAPSTGRALGELYWTGISGILEALLSALATPVRGASAEKDDDGRDA